MDLITKKDIEELDSIYNTCCISIFIPTHRTGKEVLQRQDVLLLKNQLKEVKAKLEQEELSGQEIEDIVAPIRELMDDSGFWRHRSEGLALFLTDGIFKKYSLPIAFKPLSHVGNSFYLMPLLPIFTGDGSFFVLSLELEKVKLYKQTRYSSTELVIEDVVPSRLEDRVGYDYEQKNLQFRSQQEGHGEATFHGHGAGDRDRKDEIARYFTAIDKGLMTLIADENSPMIVACQDFLFPIYQKANTYTHLLDDHIVCNLSEADESMLQRLAWKKMEPIFDRERKEKKELFKQQNGTGKTSSEIQKVVPAAIDGRVDTLFLQDKEDIRGVYEPKTRHVRVDNALLPSNVSLLNKAAISTFLNGGKVYVTEKENMPDPHAKVNALYRY
ncbi:hypothetical protein ED312_22310 [Sinomicrobium pectinilyticum]|uniref:Uncharacterized protein n=1 Tax=Sinomicrobium pectinilyticum TaxID=1084421 RepID=A0A3N0D0V0_SINP1|nr:hypothetical protein [Sinomicrobium pectinilyticum]RNL69264.1 hypothetical protein ED312_22310 [Sinomicrobium pectinilyticum]